MASTRITTSLTETLGRRLDEQAVREGISRSALVRDALEAYLCSEDWDEISRQIVEGYERIPPTPDEWDWSDVKGEGAGCRD